MLQRLCLKVDKIAEVKQVDALPKPLAVTDVEMSEDVLTITALSTQACPCCPLCGKPSARVHSRYLRQVADLPCGRRQVRLLVQVRKCFCETPDCSRKIFVERLTPFVSFILIRGVFIPDNLPPSA